MSRAGRIAVVAAVVVVAALVGVSAAVALFARSDSICRGVSVGGVNVAGMSRSQATHAMDAWWQRRRGQVITLTALDAKHSLTLNELGAQFDCANAVARAYAVGREGGLFGRAALVLREKSAHKKLSPSIDFSAKKLGHAIRSVAASVNRPHKDASLKVSGDKFIVEPEHLGIKVDEKRAESVVRDSLLKGRALIPLPIEVDKPQVTTADVGDIDTLLATYTTQFNPGKRDRTHNLTLATKAVTGVILMPGQRFSYNDVVGERLMSKGYRNAPIFVRGNLEPGLGGGVCQVSSTIYNAVLLAGLKVVERSHHSRTVPYVRPGRDATVAYGLRDLKFENSNANPVGLVAIVKGSLLTVNLYGSASDKKNIKIFTGKVSYKPAGLKRVVDASLAPGQEKTVDHGAPGARVIVYRKVIGADGKAKTEVVSRDTYPSQAKVVATGPAAKPARPSEASSTSQAAAEVQ